MQYLQGQFPGRVMSKRGAWSWPRFPPDLKVCDFFYGLFEAQNLGRPVIE